MTRLRPNGEVLVDEIDRICPACGEGWPDDPEFYRPGLDRCLACERERRGAERRRRRARLALMARVRDAFPEPVLTMAPAVTFDLADYSPLDVSTALGFVGATHRDWLAEGRQPRAYRLLSWARIAAAFGVSIRAARVAGR